MRKIAGLWGNRRARGDRCPAGVTELRCVAHEGNTEGRQVEQTRDVADEDRHDEPD